MTLFINLDTMEYPRFDGDVALEPNTNWSEVIEVNPPVTAEDEISYTIAPELKDGSYWQVWAVRKLTEEELAPITSVNLIPAGGTFAQYSTATLYGIRKY